MDERVQKSLTHKNLLIRITVAFVLFFGSFFAVAIISYYLLPTGFLRNKNSILDLETSNNIWISAIEIFVFNSLSVIIIVLGNFFTSLNKNKVFFPNGYIFLAVQFSLNAITLGTWSFTVVNGLPELQLRLLRTFDILHRSGLWEMSGQLFIMCATATIALVKNDRIDKKIYLRSTEKLAVLIGICFMLLGAFIESNSIIYNF